MIHKHTITRKYFLKVHIIFDSSKGTELTNWIYYLSIYISLPLDQKRGIKCGKNTMFLQDSCLSTFLPPLRHDAGIVSQFCILTHAAHGYNATYINFLLLITNLWTLDHVHLANPWQQEEGEHRFWLFLNDIIECFKNKTKIYRYM